MQDQWFLQWKSSEGKKSRGDERSMWRGEEDRWPSYGVRRWMGLGCPVEWGGKGGWDWEMPDCAGYTQKVSSFVPEPSKFASNNHYLLSFWWFQMKTPRKSLVLHFILMKKCLINALGSIRRESPGVDIAQEWINCLKVVENLSKIQVGTILVFAGAQSKIQRYSQPSFHWWRRHVGSSTYRIEKKSLIHIFFPSLFIIVMLMGSLICSFRTA